MQCFLLPFQFGGAAQGSDHAALNPIYAGHLTFGGWPQKFASTDIWINLRIKGGVIMALERLERPRRKVLGQEPHPALARTRALPRKINREFGDSADGEPGGAWGGGGGGGMGGGGMGQKNGDAEVFGECFIAADWTTASEWRRAIP